MHPIISKYYFALIAIMTLGSTSFAQKNFEGKIVYRHLGMPLNGTKEIYFGNQKIKIIEIDTADNDLLQEISFIDFEKGFTYLINDINKTYCRLILKYNPNESKADLKLYPKKNKKILDYKCSAYIGDASEAIPELGLPRTSLCILYADSLFYAVDEKYTKIWDIKKITNGLNVAMGIEFVTDDGRSLENEIDYPISVSPQQIPDSFFTISPDYKMISSFLYLKQNENNDIKIDDKMPLQPPPPPMPEMPAQKHKKKKSTKGS